MTVKLDHCWGLILLENVDGVVLSSVAMGDQDANGGEAQPTEVVFHYLKSNLFRTVHVDGAWGGTTPQGFISMVAYNERFAIPQQVTYALEDGKLAGEKDRQGREGMVREMQVELLMTVETAERVRDWLRDKIVRVRELQDQQTSAESTDND